MKIGKMTRVKSGLCKPDFETMICILEIVSLVVSVDLWFRGQLLD